ncbi:MAG: ABC transporter ATP-binding protein [Pseudomonadota bacterium]
MTETAALDISGVSHSFGSRTALDDVSLQVPEGSFTALLGVNGAGKTTLFNLITRLYDNTSGAIRVCGSDVRKDPRKALAQLGVVFQSRALDGTLTVEQNFTYAGALYGISRRDCGERGAALLDRIGLSDRMGDKVRALSGGQQRRVEIARALLHRPRLLLCDEATVGLDIKSRADIVAEVHTLAAEQGVGVLWATHLIDEILDTDRVVILHKGKVLAAGEVPEITAGQTLGDTFLSMTRAEAA